MEQRVIISQNFQNELAMALTECERDKIFVLTDEITQEKCWRLLMNFFGLKHATLITIPVGDEHKTIQTVNFVWNQLQIGGATRHSCLINLGGGMVTDLGGFAASTFKRGINYINLPTTLLSMVDASVGGKTGVNFNGLKNEIGVFNDSKYVIINADFLRTLDRQNIASGYAEMLKHGLISTETMWAELVNFNLSDIEKDTDGSVLRRLQRMIADSVKVKERIVEEDPTEKGIRKALNFGHTFGHAFESWSFRHVPSLAGTSRTSPLTVQLPILHGYAVAFGLICELYLSAIKTDFPTEQMRQTVAFIRENYGMLPITCDDYPELLELMTHDKKNTADIINFTLLGDIGDIHINQTATTDEIKEALDFFREG